jgi:hypothetical protein
LRLFYYEKIKQLNADSFYKYTGKCW